jgi:hypothetical protein
VTSIIKRQLNKLYYISLFLCIKEVFMVHSSKKKLKSFKEISHSRKKVLFTLCTCCIIVIYEVSARRHFSLEARATMERVLYLLECAEYVFSYPKFVQYFLKRTLCLIYRIPFVNRMAVVHALAKMSIELTAIIFSLSKFSSSKLEKWRFVNQILLHRYYQVKLFSECSKRRILCG